MIAHATSSIERFWSKVDKRGSCWTWSASRLPAGYGRFSDGRRRRDLYAHRFSWEIHNGQIPAGMYVCHRCDNPPCVRPDHLFIGSNSDNQLDRSRKGRHHYGGRSHCIRGHEFTEANTRLYLGYRYCRACQIVREKRRQKRAAKAAK